MQASSAIRSFDFSSPSGAAFLIPRSQLTCPKTLFFCCAKFAESGNAGSHNFRVVPANLDVAEREEAQAVLTLFLKKQGLSKAAVARTIKSEIFIDHLVSRLHYVHKTRYLVGRELTTLEIRDTLDAYLETLFEEFGDIMVDVVESFPYRAIDGRSVESLEGPVVPVSAPITTLKSKKLRALARLTDEDPTGKLPPKIIYLTELGMDLELIEEVTCKFPPFAYYSLDWNIKPVVDFLIDLGVPKSNIPSIIRRRPRLFGTSLSKTITPAVMFLENLGVGKEQWAKVIHRYPTLLMHTRQKLESNVDFFYEMGAENVCKIIKRHPQIMGHSVEDRLRPAAEYFHSIGVDAGKLLQRSPQTFSLRVDVKLKPVTEFFLEREFSMEDVATMVSRYGSLWTYSLSDNIRPKWEFFLTMGYPKSNLVKFPQYFGCSLEERIKPRYAILVKSRVTFSLTTFLCPSDDEFDKRVERSMKKNVG